jgi:DNA repair protein RecO (recombination protein O)
MARAAPASAAYVLHRYDWSETSLILDLFTRDQGRLTVVAKGAKRPYSQLRPALLPFQRDTGAAGQRATRPAKSTTLRRRMGRLRHAVQAQPGRRLHLNELLMRCWRR